MTLRLVKSQTSEDRSNATSPSPRQLCLLPARLVEPSSRSRKRLLLNKVARLTDLSELGTQLLERLVDDMLDELEGRRP